MVAREDAWAQALPRTTPAERSLRGRLTPTGMAEVARAAWAAVAPLWVAGLGLYCLLVAHLLLTGPWLDTPVKRYDWAQYLVLGLGFPTILLTWLLLPGAIGAPWARAVRMVLVLFCLAAAGWLIVLARQPVPILMAVFQIALMRRLLRGPNGAPRPGLAVAATATTVFAWGVADRLIWTGSFYGYMRTDFPFSLLSFLVLLLLVCAYVGAPDGRPGRRRVRLAADIVALLLIALLAFRTDGLFEVPNALAAVHHWSLFVGPAELVREGGWLYWDVPSAYGFLSILALAVFPSATAWQGLYVLVGTFLFLTGAFLFLVLRAARPGALGWSCSLIVTAAALLFLPTSHFAATNIFPSGGPYRFFWCYALVAVLVWERRTREGTQAQGRVLVVGCLVWLLGVLWSPESAVYSSMVWLPAFAWLVGRRGRTDVRRIAGWLAVPPLLLAVTVGGVFAYYLARLGHAPDLISYLEYVVRFGQGFVGSGIERSGAGLSLVLGLCALATAAVYALREGLPARSLGLMAGVWGAFCATSTYFVGRGDPFDLTRAFLPVLCLAVGLLLSLLAQRPTVENWAILLRLGAVPILMAVLVLAGVNQRGATALVRDFELRHATGIERRLTGVEPALAELLRTAGATPDDAIVYAGNEVGNLLPAWEVGGRRVAAARSWLPMQPLALFLALPEERKPLYVNRFVERAREGGWLIQRKVDGRLAVSQVSAAYSPGPWLFAELRRTHAATKGFQNDDWSVVWFDYVGGEAGEAATRDAVSTGLYRPAPPDILVDSRPQLAGAGLWAGHVDGWFPGGADGGPRWAMSPAVLEVYSPDARQVELRTTTIAAKLDPVTGGSTLRVAANGGTPRSVALRAGEPLRVAVDLRAGWNTVTLELAEGNFRLSDYDPANTDPRLYSFVIEPIDIVSASRAESVGRSGHDSLG